MPMLTSPGQQELDKLQLLLNSQSDVLTAIVKHRTSTPGHLGHLHIALFEPKGTHVTFAIHPPPSEETQLINLPIEPPVANLFEIKSRVLGWRHEAMKHYAVPKYPKIDYYSPPGLFPYAVPAAGGLAVLFYTLFGWDRYAEWFRDQINMLFGVYFLPAAGIFAVVMHLVEPVYLWRVLDRYSVPADVKQKWLLTNLALGYAAIGEFWDCVEYERTRHIYRQTDVGDIGPRVKPQVVESESKKTQ